MGKYHSELLMLFNLAFLMKCKYILFYIFTLIFLHRKNCNIEETSIAVRIKFFFLALALFDCQSIILHVIWPSPTLDYIRLQFRF